MTEKTKESINYYLSKCSDCFNASHYGLTKRTDYPKSLIDEDLEQFVSYIRDLYFYVDCLYKTNCINDKIMYDIHDNLKI